MNIELVSPQCTIKFDYHHKWLFVELMPIALIVVTLIGHYVVLLKKRCEQHCYSRMVCWKLKRRDHGQMHRHTNAMIGGLILTFQYMYVYCTTTAFEVFSCETKEDGSSTMYFEPKIRCGEGVHKWLVPLAVLFGGLYGLGIPVVFATIVYRNRQLIKGDQVLRVLGLGRFRDENNADNNVYYEFRKRFYKLYYRFKPRYHYWGEVILLRKFAVIMCTVFMKHNPPFQATSVLMIVFISYTVHMRVTPYLRNDILNAESSGQLESVREVALLQRSLSTSERDNAFEFVDKKQGKNSFMDSFLSKRRRSRNAQVEDTPTPSESKNNTTSVAPRVAGTTGNRSAAAQGKKVTRQIMAKKARVNPQIRKFKSGMEDNPLMNNQKDVFKKRQLLSKLLKAKSHAAFESGNSADVWQSLGVHEEDSPAAKVSRESMLSSYFSMSEKAKESKKFLMDYNTMEAVRKSSRTNTIHILTHTHTRTYATRYSTYTHSNNLPFISQNRFPLTSAYNIYIHSLIFRHLDVPILLRSRITLRAHVPQRKERSRRRPRGIGLRSRSIRDRSRGDLILVFLCRVIRGNVPIVPLLPSD
jgi:hypothetical protein